MSTTGAIALAVVVTLAVVFLALALAGFRPLMPKREVLVVLRSGETLAGVLVARRPGYLILGHAALVSGAERKTPIDGTVEVDRDNVTWVQVL